MGPLQSALLALTYDALGEEDNAIDLLTQTIKLGKQGNYVRTLTDLGRPAVHLLRQVADEGVEPAYVSRILNSFDLTASMPGKSGKKNTYAASNQPLTAREHEVLIMLQQRYTNKEIARQLIISLGTVKRHTSNIYTKLGANNRRQAVEHAEILGILRSN